MNATTYERLADLRTQGVALPQAFEQARHVADLPLPQAAGRRFCSDQQWSVIDTALRLNAGRCDGVLHLPKRHVT